MSAPERIWLDDKRRVAADNKPSHAWRDIYTTEYIRADLAPSPAKVKALVWIKHPRCDVWRCDTLIGPYKVFAIKPPVSWDFDGLDNEGISLSTSKVSQSVDAAKAAAQADYEARILAALEE